jgi:hypothetical protein
MASSDSGQKVEDHMNRFLRGIPDPEPSRDQFADLWLFFGNGCCFCGKKLVRSRREGRHALAEPGARRAIGNRLVLCEHCAQRRLPGEWWRSLLRRCTRDPEVFAEREARVDEWQRRNPIPEPPESSEIAACRARAEQAISNFAIACRDLRAACRICWHQDASPPTGTARIGGSRREARSAAHHRLLPRPNPC